MPDSSPADKAECVAAKEAAVKARKVYDRDYERRNPGASSAPLAIGDLDTCRLVDGGAFAGKWGGRRFRYLSKVNGRFVADPKKVWFGDEEDAVNGQRLWFSEWRSDPASDAKNERLNKLLATSRLING